MFEGSSMEAVPQISRCPKKASDGSKAAPTAQSCGLAVLPRFLVLVGRATLKARGDTIREPHVGPSDFEHDCSFFRIAHRLCGVHTRLRCLAVRLAWAHGGRNFTRSLSALSWLDDDLKPRS